MHANEGIDVNEIDDIIITWMKTILALWIDLKI